MTKRLLPLLLFFSSCLISCGSEESSSQSEVLMDHDIIVANNDYCSISTSKTSAKKGEEVEVYVTNIHPDYALEKVIVNNEPLLNTTFVMPNQDAYVDVSLRKIHEDVVTYNVSIAPSPFAVISTEKSSYAVGETVVIDYECKGNYILSSFYVNGAKIRGNSFLMIEGEAHITSEFEYVFKDTEWQVSCLADLRAKSFWYMSYEETGIRMKVMVDDRVVCGFDIAESELYRDNVSFIISKRIDEEKTLLDNTYKIAVPAIGDAFIQKGSATTNKYTRTWPSTSLFSYSSDLKYRSNHDGYDGYQIDMLVTYELLGLSKEEALDNVSIAIGLQNATHYGTTILSTYTDHGVIWDDASTHPILKQDGTMLIRNA